MNKPSDYKIVVSSTPQGLELAVMDRIDEGWILHGSPFSAHHPMPNLEHGLILEYCQAIILP